MYQRIVILIGLSAVIASAGISSGSRAQEAKPDSNAGARNEVELYKKFIQDSCPVEDGWTRPNHAFMVLNAVVADEGTLPSPGNAAFGSFGAFKYCAGSDDSFWLYYPFVGRPRTQADRENFRVTVFGLDSQNKISQSKALYPKRLASNKTKTSITMLEFQLDASGLNAIPVERMEPPSEKKEDADASDAEPQAGFFVFLEIRDVKSAKKQNAEPATEDKNQTSPDSERPKLPADQNQSGIAVQSADAEDLLDAEAKALGQHPETLWLLPPQPLASFTDCIVSPPPELEDEFVGHIAVRLDKERVLVSMHAIVDGNGSGASRARIIIMGPDGKELETLRAANSKSLVGGAWIYGSLTELDSNRLPKYGTIGVAEK